MLFLCWPSVCNLDGLKDNNLYLSDIPVHDVMKNLILLPEQFQEDHILTKELEILTDKLCQTSRDLAEEKELTDQLLQSILPPSVALELRHASGLFRPAEKFEMFSILFSGVVDFESFCRPGFSQQRFFSFLITLQLLNNIYRQFDILTRDRINDVFFATISSREE